MSQSLSKSFSKVDAWFVQAIIAKVQYLYHVQPIVSQEKADILERPFTDNELDDAFVGWSEQRKQWRPRQERKCDVVVVLLK